MILELSSQVPPLALCQRLKALGMPQETLHCWIRTKQTNPYGLDIDCRFETADPAPTFAAPTVAELGVLLPPSAYSIRTAGGSWQAWDSDEPRQHDAMATGATEAESRAALLAGLIERGYIKWEQAK